MAKRTPPRPSRTVTIKKFLDGKVRLERKNDAPMLYARAYLQGKYVVVRTKETNFARAQAFAENWYLELRDRIRRGEQLHEPTFEAVVERFFAHAKEERTHSESQRRNYEEKWSILKSHFQGVRISQVDAAFLLRLRNARATAKNRRGERVANSTLKKDMLFVRQVLTYAKEFARIVTDIPKMPSFALDEYRILPTPRPYLTEAEYKTLSQLAKARAEDAELNPRSRRQRQELYWFILMCVGGALRVGEAYSTRRSDCALVTLKDDDKTEAVHVRVLGKHSRGGVREDAYILYGGVFAYKELTASRPDAKPDELLFTENHRDGMKELLIEAKLRIDAKTGRMRDSKSLRQTGISMRLEKRGGIDYRDIAKWARTSVAMIEQFYDQTHPQQSVERITGFRSQRAPTK